jgi:hypothetical protein
LYEKDRGKGTFALFFSLHPKVLVPTPMKGGFQLSFVEFHLFWRVGLHKSRQKGERGSVPE